MRPTTRYWLEVTYKKTAATSVYDTDTKVLVTARRLGAKNGGDSGYCVATETRDLDAGTVLGYNKALAIAAALRKLGVRVRVRAD